MARREQLSGMETECTCRRSGVGQLTQGHGGLGERRLTEGGWPHCTLSTALRCWGVRGLLSRGDRTPGVLWRAAPAARGGRIWEGWGEGWGEVQVQGGGQEVAALWPDGGHRGAQCGGCHTSPWGCCDKRDQLGSQTQQKRLLSSSGGESDIKVVAMALLCVRLQGSICPMPLGVPRFVDTSLQSLPLASCDSLPA